MSKEFIELKNKTIFITGVAGFIGSNLAERLLKEIEGIKIVGLDNMNDYYDVRLKEYRLDFSKEIANCGHFFANQSGHPLSDQTVRRIINKYTSLASISQHITPHMFRHTFATSLLDADVDIRYIQEMLGHSSINITEIYTHVTTAKQRDILTNKHPRNGFHI